jgi:hypothetical protein
MPVVYKDFGKGAKDLLSKKYDYTNEVKAVNSAAGVEIVGNSAKGGIVGSAKITPKEKKFGEFEVNIKSAGGISGKVKLPKLINHASITLNANNKHAGSVETDFSFSGVSAQLDLTSSLDATLSASFKVIDGLSAGIKAESNLGNWCELKDYNFGAQYNHSNDVIFTAFT